MRILQLQGLYDKIFFNHLLHHSCNHSIYYAGSTPVLVTVLFPILEASLFS